jgi:hypothetical protein
VTGRDCRGQKLRAIKAQSIVSTSKDGACLGARGHASAEPWPDACPAGARADPGPIDRFGRNVRESAAARPPLGGKAQAAAEPPVLRVKAVRAD